MNYFLYYLISVNVIALLMMSIDKSASKKRNKRRIPERNLLGLALFGGSIGATLGMYLFKHKTRKLPFKLGLPVIIVLQIVVFLYVQKLLEIELLSP